MQGLTKAYKYKKWGRDGRKGDIGGKGLEATMGILKLHARK
jgi:hypothetical protein